MCTGEVQTPVGYTASVLKTDTLQHLTGAPKVSSPLMTLNRPFLTNPAAYLTPAYCTQQKSVLDEHMKDVPRNAKPSTSEEMRMNLPA